MKSLRPLILPPLYYLLFPIPYTSSVGRFLVGD